jgi:uncharacterized membrane protein
MDWLNWISTVISSIAREGLRVTSVIVILAALLKVPWVQRLILRYMPRRFRQREHTRNTAILYEIRDLRARMEEMAWAAGSKSGVENGRQNTLLPLVGAPAPTTVYTTLQAEISQSKRSEMKMSQGILAGKKKFLAFVIAVLINGLNDVLGLDLSTNTLDAATYIGGGLIAVEGLLDIIRSVSNHFLQKKVVSQTVVTSDTGTAVTTTTNAVTDIEKTYHGA